jgi:hypothetical protein
MPLRVMLPGEHGEKCETGMTNSQSGLVLALHNAMI